MSFYKFTLVLPVFNEEKIVESAIDELIDLQNKNGILFEIVIVNDGSDDQTNLKLEKYRSINNVILISHDRNYGYGRALKTGIKNSKSDYIFITDIDGTYPNQKILDFYNQFVEDDVDMLVGSRDLFGSNISLIRKPPKYIINKLANFLVNYDIPDLNSGFRIFKKNLFEKYLNLLPDGFSFTSTITLAFLSEFKRVKYVNIQYNKRVGKSKIHPVKDTLNFIILILRVIIYFNPLRVFIPLSLITFFIGISLIIYRMLVGGQFLVTSIVLIFISTNFLFLGLIADLINKRK